MSPISIASSTAEDVYTALDSGPGERVALLSARTSPRKVAETLVAMANASGGLLLFDAQANRKLIGLAKPESTREMVTNAAM